jgi:SAF domain.
MFSGLGFAWGLRHLYDIGELDVSSFGCHSRRLGVIHFVVHEKDDDVGVVVVEGCVRGTKAVGWIMEPDSTIQIELKSDIPIGHKVALRDLKVGDSVIKYGVDIGRVVAPIRKGEHLHVHNVKTKRW